MARLIAILLLSIIPTSAYQAQVAGGKNKQPNDASHLKADTTNKHQITPPIVVEQQTIYSAPCEQNGQSQTPDSARHPHDWVDWLNAFSTAVIAAFTIALFCAVRRQISASRDIERSWVAVKRVGNPPENWLEEIKSGYVPGILLEFAVYGKTVARVVDSRLLLKIVPAKKGGKRLEPDLPEIPNYGTGQTYAIAGKNRMVVPPDGLFQIQAFLDFPMPTEKQSKEIKDGDTLLCGFGYVKYIDAFDEERETRACYVYDFVWGGVMRSPSGEIINLVGFTPAGPPAYNRAT